MNPGFKNYKTYAFLQLKFITKLHWKYNSNWTVWTLTKLLQLFTTTWRLVPL